jgi:hypothetical protein
MSIEKLIKEISKIIPVDNRESFGVFNQEYINFVNQFDNPNYNPSKKDWIRFNEIVARIRKEMV